jgi:flagella basal body P-ring formation protein FlgA
MKQRLLILACVASALLWPGSSQALPFRQIEVTGARIHIGDVWPDASARAATFDLGPTPQAGGSRLLTRRDLVAAFDREHVPAPAGLPDAVRVVRKTKRLAPWDVDALVRTSMASTPLHHGVVLAIVNAERPLEVAEGYARVDVEVPRAPKKAGAFSTSAVLSFFDGDGQVSSRVTVPIVLAVSEDGAAYDTPRGSSVTLVVRRNLVEVRVPGVATVDGDVGDPITVQLHGSGRLLHARLSSKDEALATEAPR